MINVTYDRKRLILKVKGHAQSGEAGHDLVCAAASILVYTLSANVTELCADRRRVRRPVLDIREGDTTIACAPVHGMQAVTTLVFDTVCAGFAVLQQRYPENIAYKVVG